MSKNNTLIENLYELAERLGGDDGAIVNEAIGLIECSISERDEARRMYCEVMEKCDGKRPDWVAEQYGWDCFKEDN